MHIWAQIAMTTLKKYFGYRLSKEGDDTQISPFRVSGCMEIRHI